MLTHGGRVCIGNYAYRKVPLASAEPLLQVMQHVMPDHETELKSSAWLQNLLFEDKVAKLKEQFSELTHAEISQMLTAADGIYDSAYALLCQRKEESQEQVRGHQGLIIDYCECWQTIPHHVQLCNLRYSCAHVIQYYHAQSVAAIDNASPALCCDIAGMAFRLLYHFCPCSIHLRFACLVRQHLT